MSDAWMDIEERVLIERYLTPKTVMLEWGSGGSTLYFSEKVRRYHSVEHDYNWFTSLQQKISNNTTLHYKPVTEPLPEHYHQSEYRHYREYLDIVYQIGEMYDVVFIDGRARRLCAIKAMPYLKEDSVVIIHDWCTRPVYHCVLDYYNLIEQIDTTPQTIAVFKLKPDWRQQQGYDINLGSFDRLNG